MSESQKETVTEQRGIQNEFMNYKFKPLTEETDKTIAQLKPPSTKAHRPLWLMYALSLSISNGVHFGKDIYIPKDIWFVVKNYSDLVTHRKGFNQVGNCIVNKQKLIIVLHF